MTRRVVVTGLGALTPVGNDAEVAWANLVAGVSGAARISLFDPSALPIQIAGEVKGFDPAAHLGAKAARYMDRCGQLAVVAARQAVADAGLKLTPELSEET
jgi:3-oxoacyl-[acyl-carrier-protein] synthase II